ncbi:Endonuclease/exonuclease/phosphatase [Penicillium chermesinum]|nr:Endonuclease/exonuclease/phosphatase [Penicillium chermesinum]
MEKQLIAREKSKAPPRSWDELQAWVLEHLAYSPAHSVSFTFVTFMLVRIANEVAPVPSVAPPSPARSSTSDPKKQSSDSKEPEEGNPPPSQSQIPPPASAAAFISGGGFRRKQRSPSVATSNPNPEQQPAVARRQAVESDFASPHFTSAPAPAKEKERRASDERKKCIIEPFLKMIGVDEQGPSGGRT